ncbi:MAG: hypothetical protein EHM41_25155 [Chloroflexi bacterium]|nr:MAG: hypothetical protein EHM41_25155 [Chloroflexota bacterium]
MSNPRPPFLLAIFITAFLLALLLFAAPLITSGVSGYTGDANEGQVPASGGRSNSIEMQTNITATVEALVPTPFSTEVFETAVAVEDAVNESITSYPDPSFAATQTAVDAVQEVAAPVVESEEFMSFVSQVTDGVGDLPRGIYIEGQFALPILQQPENDAMFVSTEDGTTTLFSSAAKQGITGLLAHNYLSGLLFYNLQAGEEIRIVYGNGTYRRYVIEGVYSFQRMNFDTLSGDFIDLATNERMSSNDVFARFYSGSEHVTLQTCLERDGKSNWGLIFVVAWPMGEGVVSQ